MIKFGDVYIYLYILIWWKTLGFEVGDDDNETADGKGMTSWRFPIK